MTYTIKTCSHCNKPFQADLKEVNRGNAKYCSRSCSAKARKSVQPHNASCSACGNSFYRKPSALKISKSGHVFCSRKCKETAQTMGSVSEILEIQPAHYKDGYTRYRRKALQHYGAECNRCGYDKYESLLEVHHLDRDRSNGDIDNLEVLCVRCHLEDHMGNCDGSYTKGVDITSRNAK